MSEVNERRERLITALSDATDAIHHLGDDERAAYAEGVAIVERVLAYAHVVVEQTDPDLITDEALSEIEEAANGIVANLTAAVGNPRAYVDPLLAPLATLPVARDRDVEQSVKDTAANFQRSASQRLNALESDVEAKTAEIDAALTELRQSVAETTTATTAEIEANATAFETKLTEFETTLTSQREVIATAQERHSQSFTDAQEERAEAFQAEVGKARADVTSMLDEARQEIDRHVDEIRRMERDTAGMVGAIGLAGTAERYGEEAEAQQRIADRLRTWTIILALGAVAMAAFAVFHQADETAAVIAKLGVSVVFGALATYTGRQSGRHRVREERARNLQLELTAFAPFIEPLDDDQKEVERVIMTRKTFGQIAALPEASEIEHSFGPLGPALDKLSRRPGGDTK